MAESLTEGRLEGWCLLCIALLNFILFLNGKYKNICLCRKENRVRDGRDWGMVLSEVIVPGKEYRR